MKQVVNEGTREAPKDSRILRHQRQLVRKKKKKRLGEDKEAKKAHRKKKKKQTMHQMNQVPQMMVEQHSLKKRYIIYVRMEANTRVLSHKKLGQNTLTFEGLCYLHTRFLQRRNLPVPVQKLILQMNRLKKNLAQMMKEKRRASKD